MNPETEYFGGIATSIYMIGATLRLDYVHLFPLAKGAENAPYFPPISSDYCYYSSVILWFFVMQLADRVANVAKGFFVCRRLNERRLNGTTGVAGGFEYIR